VLEEKEGVLVEVCNFLSPEGLHDCTWNEGNQNQVATASADGSVSVWDTGASDGAPVESWRAHSAEVVSVDWNFIDKAGLLSASWDGCVKLWRPESSPSPPSPSSSSSSSPAPPTAVPLATFSVPGHCHQEHARPHRDQVEPGAKAAEAVAVYNVTWSPHHPDAFASSHADGSVRTWDPRARSPQTASIRAHDDHALAVDYDKYAEHLVVSGGADRTARVWDTRFLTAQPVNVLAGHAFAVKRLKCHPHHSGVLGTASYDMTACLWDARPLPELQQPAESVVTDPPTVDFGGRGSGGGQLLARAEHSEFATGLDFNLFAHDRVATCGWDRQVKLWDAPLAHLNEN